MITPCMILTRDMSQINIQVSLRNSLRWSRLDPKNMQIKESTRLGQDTGLSHHLQRRISPLYICKGLPSSTSVLVLYDPKGQQELRPRGPSSMLPLMPLISLSMIFWPLIYLRVNILNPLPPLQSGTRWDSLVMRTKSRS